MLVYSPYALSGEVMSSSASDVQSSSSEAAMPMAYESSTKTISNGAYIGGGVASIFLGFGIGTAIQGRYRWIHSLTQGLCVGGLIAAGAMTIGDAVQGEINWTTMSLYFAFGLAFGGFRIWEVIDTWMLPDNYRIVKEPVFQVLPLAYYNQEVDNVGLGLSFQYKF